MESCHYVRREAGLSSSRLTVSRQSLTSVNRPLNSDLPIWNSKIEPSKGDSSPLRGTSLRGRGMGPGFRGSIAMAAPLGDARFQAWMGFVHRAARLRKVMTETYDMQRDQGGACARKLMVAGNLVQAGTAVSRCRARILHHARRRVKLPGPSGSGRGRGIEPPGGRRVPGAAPAGAAQTHRRSLPLPGHGNSVRSGLAMERAETHTAQASRSAPRFRDVPAAL